MDATVFLFKQFFTAKDLVKVVNASLIFWKTRKSYMKVFIFTLFFVGDIKMKPKKANVLII